MRLIRIILKKLQRVSKFKINRLLDSLPDFSGITLIDIGAAGDIEPRWKQISNILNYVGFEPDARSQANTISRAKECKQYVIHPLALWSYKGVLPIRLAKKSEVSSYFPINENLVAKFPDSRRFEQIAIEEIPCDTLDNLGISGPHFIKLDIQGGELEAILGAQATINECLGIELEVEFTDLYVGQPIFGEISMLLKQLGFELFDFTNLCRWERDSLSGLGQMIFGDALFLRTPESVLITNPNNQKLSNYFAILALYNRFDLIEYVGKNLNSHQTVEYKKFILDSAKSRKDLTIVQLLIRGISGLFKILNPAFKLHLLN
jgi:FkbM family methyltransferase